MLYSHADCLSIIQLDQIRSMDLYLQHECVHVVQLQQLTSRDQRISQLEQELEEVRQQAKQGNKIITLEAKKRKLKENTEESKNQITGEGPFETDMLDEAKKKTNNDSKEKCLAKDEGDQVLRLQNMGAQLQGQAKSQGNDQQSNLATSLEPISDAVDITSWSVLRSDVQVSQEIGSGGQ